MSEPEEAPDTETPATETPVTETPAEEEKATDGEPHKEEESTATFEPVVSNSQ
jgi:hypothetical protein